MLVTQTHYNFSSANSYWSWLVIADSSLEEVQYAVWWPGSEVLGSSDRLKLLLTRAHALLKSSLESSLESFVSWRCSKSTGSFCLSNPPLPQLRVASRSCSFSSFSAYFNVIDFLHNASRQACAVSISMKLFRFSITVSRWHYSSSSKFVPASAALSTSCTRFGPSGRALSPFVSPHVSLWSHPSVTDVTRHRSRFSLCSRSPCSAVNVSFTDLIAFIRLNLQNLAPRSSNNS